MKVILEINENKPHKGIRAVGIKGKKDEDWSDLENKIIETMTDYASAGLRKHFAK